MVDDLTRYYDEVRSFMDCPEEEQNLLLSDINNRIMELQADGLHMNHNELVNFFGEAEELAPILMAKADPVTLRRHHLKKKLRNVRKYVVVAVVIIAMLCTIGYTSYNKENVVYAKNKHVIIVDQ